ncbi:MAG: Hsp20/alpha crystallin family protein [Deltaproteobacteria bacterium]|nr:Hsp20/alpha crystallin family protein [Candidatus Anaeroferrophillus wilburensis]MBN2888934.1 Hsp20/alpha crystallin family protein [Deltaproteobacteria bacterium]
MKENIFSQPSWQPWGEDYTGSYEFTPHVDVIEGPLAYRLLLMIAGVEPDQLTVEVDDNVLVLAGERRRPALEHGELFARAENHYGVFERRFILPDSADKNGVRARYEHGVLEVAIAKKAAGPARYIPVAGGDG